MRSFKDTDGREWPFSINVAAVKRVRGLLAVDLYSLVDDRFQGLAKLVGDPVSLVDVLYVLCKDEADRRGTSDEDFGRAMGGDCLERATSAFLEELVDFFPDARVRAGLRKVIEASRVVGAEMMSMAMDRLDKLDLAAEARRLSGSSTGSPGSSGSTPGPSRFAS